MSRIIVKGLPIYYNEDKLKDFFSRNGKITVTDIKLMKKNNGESRRFAFIGFKSLTDAENAVSFFNNSFIDTSKISVEFAKTFNDPNLPLTWKEREKNRRLLLLKTEEKLKKLESYENQKPNKRQKVNNDIESKIQNNQQLKEFMETMKSSNNSRSWTNDEIVNVEGAPSSEKLNEALNIEGSNDKEINSDEEYEDFKKIEHEKLDDEISEPMISLDEIKDKNDENENENKNEHKDGSDEPNSTEMNDLDWFKSRRKRIIEDKTENKDVENKSKINDNSDSEEIKDSKPPKQNKPVEEPIEEPKTIEERHIDEILKTGRLFLRNILYSSTEDDFKELFLNYGPLKEVHIAVDTRNGKCKGFAYVQFENPKDAIKAYIELDKQIFQGRLLHILPGQPKKEHKLDEFELKNMPLKKQKLLKKKFEASKQEFSWNSLYMNSDSIMESVASQLGITKSELIDPTNSNSSVKQALAEAHVINNVRKFFEDKGIDLTKFSKKEKDDKVILVKNFQYGTTKEELGELFSTYGELNRILMPPSGTIAIVEFKDSVAGKVAFSKLAFRRLGKSILYLEKGPKNLFTGDADSDDVIQPVGDEKENVKEIKQSTSDIMTVDKEDTEEENNNNNDDNFGPTVSIFIKNLNFSTNINDLTKMFKPYPGFILAIIKNKPDNKNPGKTLSMGFGFAEFKTKDQANTAIKELNGHILDGHKLQLKVSNRIGSSDNEANNHTNNNKSKKSKSSKIIVKNLPFEATRKDVFELFNSFGSLKSVRVPKKFDKSARGFAFVEFSTAKEANSAMDQLQGVHLLGRRLVLDFAEKDTENVEEEIEKMTKKVRNQVNSRKLADIREGNSGKRKLELGDENENEGF